MKKRIVVGISGASGVIYGITLVKELLAYPMEVHVIITETGRKIIAHELHHRGDVGSLCGKNFDYSQNPEARLIEYEEDDLFAAPASGSFRYQGMVVVPCSMKTLSGVAGGLAENLLLRAADVCLKERRTLILVPRETPLNRIHISNMARAADAGAIILPPTPAFYFGPKTVQDMVDFVVGRILDQLGLEHKLVREWGDEDVL
ncbi:MAG: UbiX family flavin prenyltransferase [Desulfatiglans sp.]|jgi:4-hydroxy-3-polyprenylbenzoate decarboxylase|nr:UbiX family flavin prenyltransferase [Desulfatiglans sp.]